MSWLDHLTNHWTKRAALKVADGDTDISQGPPNLRAAAPLGPSCDKCTFYNLGMATCRKYGVQTHPQQVCDDFEGGQIKAGVFPPQNPSGSTSLAQPPLKPIAPMPLADGSRPNPGHHLMSQTQVPPGHPAQRPLENNRQPSVVAQVTDDPQQAAIMNMFSPPPQQKTGASILTDLFLDRLRHQKPLVLAAPQGNTKHSAVSASGDPLPKDWNKETVEPTKTNGGLRSDGREAWDSVKGYRRKGSDLNNFDKAWHTAKGKEK